MDATQYTNFLISALKLLASKCRDGALAYVCMDWRHAGELINAGKEAFSELKNLCVWAKDRAGMGSFYRSQHELIFVFKTGNAPHLNNIQLGKFGRYRSNIWEYPAASSFSRSKEEGNLLALHPTPKPAAMVADAILDCTKRGDIVIDSFLGSGTSLIAAEKVGRRCFGLELAPKYVDVAVRRWEAFTGKAAVHAHSGLTFAQAEQEVVNAQL